MIISAQSVFSELVFYQLIYRSYNIIIIFCPSENMSLNSSPPQYDQYTGHGTHKETFDNNNLYNELGDGVPLMKDGDRTRREGREEGRVERQRFYILLVFSMMAFTQAGVSWE